MIDVKLVNAWRLENVKAHKDLKKGGVDLSEIQKAYAVEYEPEDTEVRAWQLIEKTITKLGFDELFMENGHLMTRYGGILCRVFLAHEPKHREYTVLAKDTTGSSLVQVGQFQIAGATKLTCKQMHLDIAALVMPHKNS